MHFSKKHVLATALAAILAVSFTACGEKKPTQTSSAADTTTTAVSTTTVTTTEGTAVVTTTTANITTKKPIVTTKKKVITTTTKKDLLTPALARYNAATQKITDSQLTNTRTDMTIKMTIGNITMTENIVTECRVSNTKNKKALVRTSKTTSGDETSETKEYLGDSRYYLTTSSDESLNSAQNISAADAQALIDECFDSELLTKSNVSSFSEEKGYLVFKISGKEATKIITEQMGEELQGGTIKVKELIVRAKLDSSGKLIEEQVVMKFNVAMEEGGMSIDMPVQSQTKVTYLSTANMDFTKPAWAVALDQ